MRTHPPLRAGNGALQKNDALFVIDGDDFDILRGVAGRAHMAGHLLALEDLRAPGTDRSNRANGARSNAVRGAKTAEIVPLHRAGETLALGSADDIDLLAGDEMAGARVEPTSTTASSDTRNSATLDFGSTFALAK